MCFDIFWLGYKATEDTLSNMDPRKPNSSLRFPFLNSLKITRVTRIPVLESRWNSKLLKNRNPADLILGVVGDPFSLRTPQVARDPILKYHLDMLRDNS